MPDRLFTDSDLAALYDLFCPWEKRDDFRFYLPMVMAAGSVLDVGCGTGALLHRARQDGHGGRLCGLDPAPGMLEQARRRTDIEWVLGDLGSSRWKSEFDLIVMTGHAFQVWVGDDELRVSFAAIHTALADGGRFAFETRNPLARAWERWSATEIVDAKGATIRMSYRVDEPVDGDVVRFGHTFSSPSWPEPQTSRSALRFLDVDSLSAFLTGADLQVEEQFGDWDRSPLTAASPEMITVARCAD